MKTSTETPCTEFLPLKAKHLKFFMVWEALINQTDLLVTPPCLGDTCSRVDHKPQSGIKSAQD